MSATPIDYAHSRGVIHRDLKPANIIVGKHGETLVVDWGLAKAVGRADPSVGEQTLAPRHRRLVRDLAGQRAGHAGLHEPGAGAGRAGSAGPAVRRLQPGRHPLLSADRQAAVRGGRRRCDLRAVQEGHFPRPSQLVPALDKALEAVCLKAMATQPEDRYPTPKALADDLDRWMADEPVTAWREPIARRARRWARRNRTAVTAAAGGPGGRGGRAVGRAGRADPGQGRPGRSLNRERNAKTDLAKTNNELTRSQAAVQARYDLAVEAIKTFHTGVSEDFLLKEDQFKDLRDRLLEVGQRLLRQARCLAGQGIGPGFAAGALAGELRSGRTDGKGRQAGGRAGGTPAGPRRPESLAAEPRPIRRSRPTSAAA